MVPGYARYRERVAAKDVRVVEASGRTIEISNPDKIYFPELGATKSDLVSYYLEIAEALANTATGRPALLERFPGGAGGKSFFQKRVPANAPELAPDHRGQHSERHDVQCAGRRRHLARPLGGQSGVPRSAPVAVPCRRP